jgi:polyribonucleotide nucleotidyltransferase
MIDRPVRPLFDEGFKNETQVIALVLSADPEIEPGMHAICGASTALFVSNIPFNKPVGAVRVGLIDGRYVINPTYTELKSSRLNLAVAGMEDGIVMVESGASEVSEEIMVEALNTGHEAIKQIIALQKQLFTAIRPVKRTAQPPATDKALATEIEKSIRAELEDALDTKKYPKIESYARIDAAKQKLAEKYAEADEEKLEQVKRIFDDLKERIFRDHILNKRERPDKRKFDEIRPIWIETGLLPRTHGSAVFTRGETQALVTATLGTSDDEQRMDLLEGEAHKRFLLHYNFPPFSVGETGRMTGPDAAKSATARWRNGHSPRFFRALRAGRTRFALSPTFSSRMDPPPWLRFAVELWQ